MIMEETIQRSMLWLIFYDLKKFDLNLLVIFECIYQHLSISKAAESLYITPFCC